MNVRIPALPNQATRRLLAGRDPVELLVILAVQLILALVVLVPGTPLVILRPVAAFLYLLIVPGLLLVRLVRIYEDDPLAQLVTAVGLSLVYDMVLALALSAIPSSLIARPLSTEVFLPTSLAITLTLSLEVRSKQRLLALFNQPGYLMWAVLPLVAVAVALHVQGGGSNGWMALLLAAIAASPSILLLRKHSPAGYVVAIFCIGLALAFHKYFVSPELLRWDIRVESFYASQVLHQGRWSPGAEHIYQAMLSTTSLPAIAALLNGLDLTMTFKLLSAVILALVPVTLFLSFRELLGTRWAALIALLYAGHRVFTTGALDGPRQNVAALLVCLIILTTTAQAPISWKLRGLQLVLALAVVFSHYSTAGILIVTLCASVVLAQMVRWRVPESLRQPFALPSFWLLIATVIFAYIWFYWASDGRLISAYSRVGVRVLTAITDGLLFNRQATNFSGGIPAGISYKMLLAANFAIVMTALIGLTVYLKGVITRKDIWNRAGILGFGGILVGGIFFLVPETSESIDVSRALFLTLPWLLPLSVYGMKWLAGVMEPSRKSIRIPLLISACIAVFTYIGLGTGLVTHVEGGESLSYALADTQLRTLNRYDQSSLRFVSSYRDDGTPIYADWTGEMLFLTMDPKAGVSLSRPELPTEPPGAFYLYLRSENLAGTWSRRVFRGREGDPQVAESEVVAFISELKGKTDLVYSNGGAELYYSGPELTQQSTFTTGEVLPYIER